MADFMHNLRQTKEEQVFISPFSEDFEYILFHYFLPLLVFIILFITFLTEVSFWWAFIGALFFTPLALPLAAFLLVILLIIYDWIKEFTKKPS